MRAAQILEMHDVSFAFGERAAPNSSQISPNEVDIFETGKHPKQIWNSIYLCGSWPLPSCGPITCLHRAWPFLLPHAGCLMQFQFRCELSREASVGEKSIKHFKVAESFPGGRPWAKSCHRLSQLTHIEDFASEDIHEDGRHYEVAHLLGIIAGIPIEVCVSQGFSTSTPLTFGAREFIVVGGLFCALYSIYSIAGP